MADTIAKIPHRIHVLRDTGEASQIPEAGLTTTICRKATKRNTTECTSATMARLRLVKMENSPIPACKVPKQRACGCDPDHKVIWWQSTGTNKFARPALQLCSTFSSNVTFLK